MSSENKIEFYFLGASAEKFATDLRHFARDVHTFSDEQLIGIVLYCDHIRDNMHYCPVNFFAVQRFLNYRRF